MWLLIGASATVIIVGMWKGNAQTRSLGLLLCVGAAATIVATSWEADVAVASALRWSLAGFVVLGSVPIWKRRDQ